LHRKIWVAEKRHRKGKHKGEIDCPATGEIEACLKEQLSKGARGQTQGTRKGEQGVRGSGTEKEREKEQRVKEKNSERMGVLVCLFHVTKRHLKCVQALNAA